MVLINRSEEAEKLREKRKRERKKVPGERIKRIEIEYNCREKISKKKEIIYHHKKIKYHHKEIQDNQKE